MAGDNGPNKRGGAHRSKDRNTRYATHVPCLQACVEALEPSADRPMYVIEHGMGLGSTPFFHTLPHVMNIISFEREPEWLFCNDCLSGSTQPHSITLLDDKTAIDQASVGVTDPERTVGLVDGFASQRMAVLEAWMRLGVAFIVEHDADVFSGKEVRNRRALATNFGYKAYQYTGHDPESAIFINSHAALPLTGSCVEL